MLRLIEKVTQSLLLQKEGTPSMTKPENHGGRFSTGEPLKIGEKAESYLSPLF